MTTIYTPKLVKLEDLWTTVELHVLASAELPKRLGKTIKGMGGEYSATRGHQHTRYVTLPAYARRTIEDIYAMFKVECVILRGSTQLRQDLQQITQYGTKDRVVQVPKGADPLTMLYGEVREYSAAEWANAERLAQARAEAAAAAADRKAQAVLDARVRRAAPDLLAALEGLMQVTCFPATDEQRVASCRAAQHALNKARYDSTDDDKPSFNFDKATA